MNGYIFSTQAAAGACVSPVDSNQGYPKPGVDVGGGVHVTPTFVTQTYFTPRKHPVNAQWAYISDPISDPPLQAQAVALSLPASTVLDATWFPAPAANASAMMVGP